MSDAVRPLLKVCEGQCLAAAPDGNRRLAVGCRCAMKADYIGESKHGGLARHELAVRVVNDEIRYPAFRIFRDLAQQRTELCRQPRDRRGVE
jgi:hypothetical protein